MEQKRERKRRSLEKFGKLLKWRKALEESKERECEKIWESWLETHNKVAESTIGRTLKPKKRHWKGKSDPKILRAVREQNKARKKMGETKGEEREKAVSEIKQCRSSIKKLVREKERREKEEVNRKLEQFRGKDEKEYWNYFKKIAGLPKKQDTKLPQAMKLGEELVRGEKLEQVWNESFSKLGKFDENDIAFDKIFYKRVKNKIESWEQTGKVSTCNVIELDRDIDMKEP